MRSSDFLKNLKKFLKSIHENVHQYENNKMVRIPTIKCFLQLIIFIIFDHQEANFQNLWLCLSHKISRKYEYHPSKYFLMPLEIASNLHNTFFNRPKYFRRLLPVRVSLRAK